MKEVMRKAAALIAAAALAVTGYTLPAFAEADTGEPEAGEISVENESVHTSPKSERNSAVTLPSNMRAAVLTPGTDFFTDSGEDASALDSELDNIYTEFSEIGLNSVIINTVSGENAYYSLEQSETADPVLAAVTSAYEFGLSPYVVFDIGHALSDCRSGSAAIDTLVSKAHRFAVRYPCTGIILDDYYLRRGIASFGDYMDNGSGIGYGNWLYDAAEQYFSNAADVIRGTDNSIAVGFFINDMWANSSVNAEGSATNDAVQALYDGHADTKSFIENGYVDFAVVRAYGSITSTSLPFEEVTGWWGTIAENAGIPLYVLHHNEYVGTSTVGWGSADQLLKQLAVAKEVESYSGSAFNSYADLVRNPLGSTDALRSYFNEQIDEDSLFEDLKMTSPANLVFTTTEPSVTFMGTFDSNFPVLFNGEEIKLNDAGNFYFEEPLSDGLNTFTVSHKSKTYTYSITRRITVLKSIGSAVAEGKTLTVDGGTKIKLTAYAYKGANVYGTVYGTTVPMSEAQGAVDEEDVNSSYVRYIGTYTAPEGIVGQAQALGKIKIFASYSGYSMEAVGASVTVNAKPEPVRQSEVVMKEDAENVGSGEVLATLTPAYTAGETVQFVKVSNDNTIVYDGKTADDIPSPLFSQLPAGTLEVFRAESGSYYITESGKRISSSASTLETAEAITQNSLFVKSVGTTGGSSYIKMKLDHRTGFNMRLAGNTYYTAWDGDYNVSDFTATHLYITFENLTSVTALPSFEHNLVFRSGKWDTVTEDNGTKFRLILELRQPGVYFGHSARYDSSGDLILSFPVPTNILSGLTIVIDPGHGYGKSPTVFDPGAIGEVVEQEAVLAIAKELEAQLKYEGATVVRLKTEGEYLLTKERPLYARQYGCDLFISIHANKADGTARGAEAYYFTSYSEPLAAEISKGIAKYYQNSVYSDGADKNRGARYSYYHVTLQQDFPSVLVETGFVDNIQDAMALASDTHRAGIAAGIVSGIKNYIARSSIAYATEGYDAAEKSVVAATLPAATTAAPAQVTSSAASSAADTTKEVSEEEEDAETPEDEEVPEGTDASSDTPASGDGSPAESDSEDAEVTEVTEPADDDPGEPDEILDDKEDDPLPSDADTTSPLTATDGDIDDIDDISDDE
ncbi:MAG: N-acetylmuramoyl-L-alanine amidase [Ruminiclostridium sp.]|nr:N-acetylmuramoyl-L-alanine amidase [Ruminiclostridium sp.]